MQSQRNATGRKYEGIRLRHARSCPAREGRGCRCKPSYEAHVWSAREQRRIFKTFGSLAEARSWRADAQVALRKGTMRAPSRVTVREAGNAWLRGAKEGTITERHRRPYKPKTLRDYEGHLERRIFPRFGGARLS